MALKYALIGAISLVPTALYAQETVTPELPDFESELVPLGVPALELEGGSEKKITDDSDASTLPEIAVPDIEAPALQDAVLAVDGEPAPDISLSEPVSVLNEVVEDLPKDGDSPEMLEPPALTEAVEQAAPLEDPFAGLEMPLLKEDDESVTPDVTVEESELVAPDIPDIALEEGGADLPDFEAEMPDLPVAEEALAEADDVPALPVTPDGLPLLTLPPLPGETGGLQGAPAITFGATDSQGVKQFVKADPNKKYAGKMPRNPAKTSIRNGYNFKRQYLPSEMYKTHYRRQNSHLPVVQTLQQYESAFFSAAMENRVSDMRALMGHVNTVALRGDNGITPLMAAASKGAHDAIVYLLHHGADKNAVNFSGNRASDYARNDPVALGLLNAEYYVVSELK